MRVLIVFFFCFCFFFVVGVAFLGIVFQKYHGFATTAPHEKCCQETGCGATETATQKDLPTFGWQGQY